MIINTIAVNLGVALGQTGKRVLLIDADPQGRLPKIYDIPIELIDDFPDHPFKVKEDGRYEIVSGHRRKKACEIATILLYRLYIWQMRIVVYSVCLEGEII